MKTAKKTVDAIVLDCPYCKETIVSPTGSLYWASFEFLDPGTPVECPECGKKSKFPKV
jgi:ribosomal protein S27E